MWVGLPWSVQQLAICWKVAGKSRDRILVEARFSTGVEPTKLPVQQVPCLLPEHKAAGIWY